jgi:hypothetical protein
MLDALAYEPQFLDHLAPVWAALPERGRFLVPPELLGRATAAGIAAEALRVDMHRPAAGDPARRALVASYGDIKKGRRLGYGAFAFLEHGIGQSYNGDHHSRHHPSYAGGMDRADCELFLVPNETAAAAWRVAYPRATVAIVGSPRLDALPRREPGPGPVVAVSFHVSFSFSPETKSAYGHYRLTLPELAQRYQVIGHSHPRWADTMVREYRRLGIEFVPDFAAVCRRADVYVCDNSSTLYEFASTGRPVVVLNAPGYRRDVDHGLRFWEAADVGVQVDEPGALIAGINEALADPVERKVARETALAVVYGLRTNGAAAAATAINDWMASRQAVAA